MVGGGVVGGNVPLRGSMQPKNGDFICIKYSYDPFVFISRFSTPHSHGSESGDCSMHHSDFLFFFPATVRCQSKLEKGGKLFSRIFVLFCCSFIVLIWSDLRSPKVFSTVCCQFELYCLNKRDSLKRLRLGQLKIIRDFRRFTLLVLDSC